MSTTNPVQVSDSSYQPTPVRRKRHLLNQEKEFVLVSARIEDVKIQWGGETVVVPGRAKVILPHPKYSDVRHSYVNPATGKMVPGTMVIRDIIVTGELQEREVRWDSASLILNKIGQDFEQEFGKRGIAWVEVGAEREELMEVFRQAKAKFEESIVFESQTILWERQQQEKKYASSNMPPPPMPAYVAHAVAIVKKAAQIQERTVQELLDDVAAEGRISESFELAPEVDLGGIAPRRVEDLVEGGLDSGEETAIGAALNLREPETDESGLSQPSSDDVGGARATKAEQESIKAAAAGFAKDKLVSGAADVEKITGAVAPNRLADESGVRPPKKK